MSLAEANRVGSGSQHTSAEQGGAFGHRWHDLDLEAQALAIEDRVIQSAAGREVEAVREALGQIRSLVERDRAARAEDILYLMGAERMLVEQEPIWRRLLIHIALNRYAIWTGERVRYYSKHSVGGFSEPISLGALDQLMRVQQAGLSIDEVAIFRDEYDPDPILAIRIGRGWYALYSWE